MISLNQCIIYIQLTSFRNKSDKFGTTIAQRAIKEMHPGNIRSIVLHINIVMNLSILCYY